MIDTTMDRLKALRLNGMAAGLSEQMTNGMYRDLSFEERVSMLVDREETHRDNRRLSNLLRCARFRYPAACVEDMDLKSNRGISRDVMLSLAKNTWIKEKQNIIITGSTGTGKTYIACAIGISACRAGISALYFRLPRLLQELAIARADGSYGKLLSRISKISVLILDDWGLARLADNERRDLFEILEDRQGIASTIIAGQAPVEAWHQIIGDPAIADALCDRVVHNAHKLNLKGESMRKKQSKLT